MMAEPMKLTVNGEAFEHNGDATVAGLLDTLGTPGSRVAVMVNGEVVRSAARSAVELKTGDRIEIITFAGGG